MWAAALLSTDIAQRVDLAAVLQHFEVHVRARGAAGVADEGQGVTAGYRAAYAHRNRLVMAVASDQAIPVIDLDQGAVARLLTGEGDHTRGDGNDVRTPGSREID